MTISCINFPKVQSRKTEFDISKEETSEVAINHLIPPKLGHLQLPPALDFGEHEQLPRNNFKHGLCTFEQILTHEQAWIFRLKTW